MCQEPVVQCYWKPRHLCLAIQDVLCTDRSALFFSTKNADSEGGAVLASGVAEFDDCTFDGNRASSGLAISNTLSATIDRAEFRNNMLLCDDDSEFVEWEDVSGLRLGVLKVGGIE